MDNFTFSSEHESSDEKRTQLSNFDDGKNYVLSLVAMTRFFRAYIDALRDGTGHPPMGEQWRNFQAMPIIFFLDFRFVTVNEDSVVDYMALVYIARYLGEIIEETITKGLIHDSEDESDYRSIVTVSSDFVIVDRIKHLYMRVQFPHMRVEPINAPHLYKYLYSAAARRLTDQNMMQYFNDLDNTDWEDILHNPLNNGIVPLMGTSIDGGTFEEKVVGVVHYEDDWDPDQPITLRELLSKASPREIFTVFKPKKHSAGRNLTGSDLAETVVILALAYGGADNCNLTYNLAKLMTDSGNLREDLLIYEDTPDEERLRIFLELIDPVYWSERSEWVNLGDIFYNVYHNSDLGMEEGLEIWKRFTAQHTKFDPAECEILYGKTQRGYTVKTLAWIARQENPDDYKRAVTPWRSQYIEHMCREKNCQNVLAKLFYSLNWLDVMVHNTGGRRKRQWYRFVKGQWEPTSEDRIITLFFNSLDRLIRRWIDTAGKQLTQEKTISANLYDHLRRMQSYNWSSNSLKWVYGMVEFPGFNKWADRKLNLMGFANQYTECIGKEIVTRPGRPEDYVTIYSETTLRVMSWENRDVKKFMRWLDQIFPDTELRDYFLKIFASGLCADGNLERIFPIMVSGGNSENSGSEGKTSLKTLIDTVYGDYSYTPDARLFSVSSRSAESASPVLAGAKNKRWLWINEISKHETLNEGLVKQLTGGGEKVYARLLQSNNDSFTVNFIPVMVCNSIPNFSAVDSAVISRTKIIPFFSRWQDDAPDDIAEQYRQRRFKKDARFRDEVHKLAPAALWVLTQYYPRVVTEGLKTPRIVSEFTDQYWRSRDVQLQYINDRLITTGRADDNMLISELRMNFMDWLRNLGDTPRDPKKYTEVLLDKLQSRGVTADKFRVTGLRFKVDAPE